MGKHGKISEHNLSQKLIDKINSITSGTVIVSETFTTLPKIVDLPELKDNQLAMVCIDEYPDDPNIVYYSGFYIYNLETDSWEEFDHDKMNLLDVSDTISALWYNTNFSENLDNVATKKTLKLVIESNNAKINEKIDSLYETATFADCNEMMETITSILRGEA